MHTLLVGAPGVGKSKVIRRLLEELDRPLAGFITVKEDDLAADWRGSPIYIYYPEGERTRGEENLVGYCDDGKPISCPEKFAANAHILNSNKSPDAIVVMDELGFMETRAEEFRAAVMELLDGDRPVIAAVKDMDNEFLNKVRSHPKCRSFFIRAENREEMYPAVRDFFMAQL